MNEAQEILYDLARPIWLQQAKDCNISASRAKLIFLCFLQNKLRDTDSKIKMIDTYTDEEIAQVIPVIENLQKIVE